MFFNHFFLSHRTHALFHPRFNELTNHPAMYKVWERISPSDGRDENGSGRRGYFTFSYLLSMVFFVGCGAERILHGCGFEDGFFRMLEIVRSRTEIEADANYIIVG